MPLPHFCDLISPPAETGLCRSFPHTPQCRFTLLHAEQGSAVLPQLPFPCRPTSPASGLSGPLCVGVGRSNGVPLQRPLQPYQPQLQGIELRRFAKAWRAFAWGLPHVCICKLAALRCAPFGKAHNTGLPDAMRMSFGSARCVPVSV